MTGRELETRGGFPVPYEVEATSPGVVVPDTLPPGAPEAEPYTSFRDVVPTAYEDVIQGLALMDWEKRKRLLLWAIARGWTK